MASRSSALSAHAEKGALRRPSDRTMIELSRQCLKAHYEQRDLEAFTRYMAIDATWIGPLEDQYAHTSTDIKRIVSPGYNTPAAIEDDVWDVRSMRDFCIVVGHYGLVVKEGDVERLHLCQTATLVWVFTATGPWIVHLHFSFSYDIPPRISRPYVCGEDQVAYLIDSVAQPAVSVHRLSFPQTDGERFVSEADIVCIKAAKKRCLVVHDEGEFEAQLSLAEAEDRLSSNFVRVHRGFLVNALRVSEVRRYEAQLDNGTTCPISERRYRDVQSQLEAAVKNPA